MTMSKYVRSTAILSAGLHGTVQSDSFKFGLYRVVIANEAEAGVTETKMFEEGVGLVTV
jgi:hypothetical protein